eukprot:450732_1
MTNKKIPVVSFIFFLMVVASVSSFSPTCLHITTLQSNRASFSTLKLFSAMERLHDPSTNAYGRVEHVYSLSEIDRITQKITDDEWAALGSVIITWATNHYILSLSPMLQRMDMNSILVFLISFSKWLLLETPLFQMFTTALSWKYQKKARRQQLLLLSYLNVNPFQEHLC